MNIKIHSSELNRMMKVINQCINPNNPIFSNIEIGNDNNLLTIRATDNTTSAVMSTPLLGGDGETFCVDGTMFSRVIGMCNGEVNIITDGKTCTIKGAGRTRLPIVDANIPEFKRINGKKVTINAGDFSKCFNSVAYAIATDQNRPALTGAHLSSKEGKIAMTALDGFQLAIESTGCVGDDITAIIPGNFLKLISSNTVASEQINITIEQGRVQADTDGMLISCTLLTGDFPDVNRILPETFATESMINAGELRNALKCGSVVNNSNNLVKLIVDKDSLSVTSNGEQAEFDADIPCKTQGESLTIAFNQKYIINTINSIGTEEIVIKFNSAISPCIVHGRNENGIHLVLPVRTWG